MIFFKTLPLGFYPSKSFLENSTHTQVIPCHYDVTSGELLPTAAISTVPGAATGVDGQTFAAAIRISGRDDDPVRWWCPWRIHENGICSYMNVVDVYGECRYKYKCTTHGYYGMYILWPWMELKNYFEKMLVPFGWWYCTPLLEKIWTNGGSSTNR